MPLTQAEELELLELEYEQSKQAKYPSAVNVPSGLQDMFFKKTDIPDEPQINPSQMPYPQQSVSRETAREYLPVAAGALGAMAGGSGIVLPSLLAGAGTTAGEVGRQKLEGGKIDLYDAVVSGGKATAGTLAGGLVFKTLSGLANKVFSPQPLNKAQKVAEEYAKENNLPLPLSSATKSRGGMLQLGAENATLPARLKTAKDANKITQYINRVALDEVPAMAQKAKPVEQVVQKGRDFFTSIYNPAKEAGQEGFDKFVSSVGIDTPVRTGNFYGVLDDAIASLQKSGLTSNAKSGGLWGLLQQQKKLGPQPKTLDEYEILRKAISKSGRKASRVAADLKEAILKDYDDVGAELGVSARELAQEAINKSAEFFRLKKDFPELEFFATNKAADDKWLGMLFSGRNAKALTYIRQEHPEIYHELSDTWLAQIINSKTRSTNGIIGKVLDGPALMKWVESNKSDLMRILGKEKAGVLSNFSQYAAATQRSVERAANDPITSMELLTRAGAEGTALFFKPHIMVPTEATAYVLAKGLSNPNSSLFKLFTSGPPELIKKGAKNALMLGGQLAVKPIDNKKLTIKDPGFNVPE